MKKPFNYIITIIISIYLLNLASFFIIGKTDLMKQILSDTHTSYKQIQWTNDVNIASNLNLNSNQIQLLKTFYSGTKADFKYFEVSEIDGVKELFSSKNKFLHYLEGDLHLWRFTYSIDESEKMAEYYHGYRRTYVWVFFDWIKIDEEFLGIS
ncbi:hypothetical protein OO013_07665 [Mangrovivirga sp. M17]|uniref:Uncharacterized protein n=1 Tax=Mangrovivirga halotolerans TaxID=2993936 RepID=A0ABT3RQH3_9BACT|nr:hypothetical protein [Mangrovivirga halotolerans]MCX2743736.1 hypothetical protein [Mangrovivirga halotolerans]